MLEKSGSQLMQLLHEHKTCLVSKLWLLRAEFIISEAINAFNQEQPQNLTFCFLLESLDNSLGCAVVFLTLAGGSLCSIEAIGCSRRVEDMEEISLRSLTVVGVSRGGDRRRTRRFESLDLNTCTLSDRAFKS